MAEILFHCPACDKALAIDEAGAEKMIRCPQCGTIIQIPTPASRFHCPACNSELCTPDTINPSSMHCPSCDSALPDNPIPAHVEHAPPVEIEPALLEKIIPQIMVITLVLILILGTAVIIKRAAIADFLFTKCSRLIPPNQQVSPPQKKQQDDIHVGTVKINTNRTLPKTAQTIPPPPAPVSNVVVRILPKPELPKVELPRHDRDTVQLVTARSNSPKPLLVSENVVSARPKELTQPVVFNDIPQKATQSNASPIVLNGGKVVWGI